MKHSKVLFFIAASMMISANNAFAQVEGFRYTENPQFKELLPSAPQKDSASYLLGVNFGMMILNYGFGDLNYNLLMEGIKTAAYSKGDPNDPSWNEQFRISPMEMGRILDGYLEIMHDYKVAVNEDKGKAFIEYYLKRYPSAKRTESGLVYRILEPGNGYYAISQKDTVVVDYRGLLVDGTEFDASESIELAINNVISGWAEGIQLVSEGGSIELVIPGELAYGERGTRGIEPNSTLIFTIKIIEVKRWDAIKAAAEAAVKAVREGIDAQ